MNPTFRGRRPPLRRTRSRSRISSSSSDSVKVDTPTGQPSPNRCLPPLRRRAHSNSLSPYSRHAAGTSRPRSPAHRPSNERLLRGNAELKHITVDIRQSVSGDRSTYRREISVRPPALVLVRRPGEGSRPLFDRDEFNAHSSDERRVVNKSSLPTSSERDDRRRRDKERSRRERSRTRSRSGSRSRSRSGRHLIDQRYVHKLRRTRSRSPRGRRRSRSRSGDRRRDHDRRGRRDEYAVMPMYSLPLRPRLPMFGPVMPYPRPFLRPIAPFRPFPRMRMFFPRVYPPFRHPFNPH